jgi:hypothetical protein
MAPEGFQPSGVVNFHRLVTITTQAYEFAARLAGELAWNTAVEVRVTLTNTANRVIVSTQSHRPIGRFWRATAPQIESGRTVDIQDLMAKARSLAAVAATEILERFAGSDIHAVDVPEIQRQLFDR